MKHAGPDALDKLEPLLKKLRTLPALKEKSRGAFYRGSRAFLHFHEDGDAFYADVRLKDDFERLPATNEKHRDALLKKVERALAHKLPK